MVDFGNYIYLRIVLWWVALTIQHWHTWCCDEWLCWQNSMCMDGAEMVGFGNTNFCPGWCWDGWLWQYSLDMDGAKMNVFGNTTWAWLVLRWQAIWQCKNEHVRCWDAYFSITIWTYIYGAVVGGFIFNTTCAWWLTLAIQRCLTVVCMFN